ADSSSPLDGCRSPNPPPSLTVDLWSCMVMPWRGRKSPRPSTSPPSRTSSSSSSIRRRASPWLSTFGRESISCSTRKGTISPGSFRWRSPTAVDPHNTAQTPAAERSTFHVAHCRTLMPTPTSLIRNFSIIAHIDHGKSTLADRLLDATGALSDRERKAQFLDSMDLERERGITIKAATVRLSFQAEDGQTYELNLIDTPGHVDFHYEVSRSLAACEGAVLVVDASQGVEAQTLANVYLAVNNNLTIIPVINKIDLPAADPENVRRQIEEVVGIDASEAILASAKEGKGIHEILEAVVAKVPPPVGSFEAPLRVLLLDSWYDSYRGVVILVRVVDGVLRPKQKVRFMAARRDYEIQTIGVFGPFPREWPELGPGEVGFFTAAIKEVADARVGDTLTDASNPCPTPLPGFQPAKPMVFAGLFPTDSARYTDLRDALDKL